MTEVEYHRSLYDPPKPKGIFGVPPHVLIASIVVVCLLFGLLAFYFVNAQFKLREVVFSDDSVDVELIEPIPPPPPPPPRPPEISNVTWQRQPAPEFPERAASRGIESGSVQLVCTVSSNGSATNCSIVSEEPSGAGFGQAALRSMSRARFSPRTVDGVAEGGRARFTVRFRLAD